MRMKISSDINLRWRIELLWVMISSIQIILVLLLSLLLSFCFFNLGCQQVCLLFVSLLTCTSLLQCLFQCSFLLLRCKSYCLFNLLCNRLLWLLLRLLSLFSLLLLILLLLVLLVLSRGCSWLLYLLHFLLSLLRLFLSWPTSKKSFKFF